MTLTPPFSLSTIVQRFGENAVSFYKSSLGLKGHPGIDFAEPWGTDIPVAIDAPCYSIFLNSDPAFYQAVFTIYDDADGNSYEVSYGHCSKVLAVPRVWYRKGDTLGQVGNTGSVFSGGVEVSEADKLAGSHAGAHLHFQVRLLKKVLASQFDSSKHHVNDGHGLYTTTDGFNYQVPLWDNGYNGCIDPAPFFEAVIAPTKPVQAPSAVLLPPTPELLASDRLALVAAHLMAQGNTAQANIVFAVARIVKAFGN